MESRAIQKAYIWSVILSTPIWAMYMLLPFIVYKDLHASALQVTAMITLKPLVSLFSLYWSSRVHSRKDRLKANVAWANVLGRLPFIFFPFVNEPWFFVAAFGFFMLMARGVTPAWMEILKLYLPKDRIKKVFAYSQSFYYLIGGILPLFFGWVMDHSFQAWRWLFPLVALLSLIPIYFQLKMPLPTERKDEKRESLWTSLSGPWKRAFQLLSSRRDFLLFQVGFMFGGAGLMVMQPALPRFFMDQLGLSYTELAAALTLCKGIGFAMSSRFWAGLLSRHNLYRFSAGVTALAFTFPLFLALSPWNLMWIYVAYLVYGVMQAGSELSWNLSGPLFARDQDSSVFTSVNVCTVGIRGCIAPPIGSLLCAWGSPQLTLFFGSFLCLIATWQLVMSESTRTAGSVGSTAR